MALVVLYSIQRGPLSEPPLGASRSRIVLAHGFTQNRNCWGPFGERLAEKYQLTLADLPGHGKSRHDDADLSESGALLAEVGGAAAYIGYSMGGRIALHTALNQQNLVTKLVLIGVNPGLRLAAAQVNRRKQDTLHASDLRRYGLSKFLDSWLANPMFANLSDRQACREQRRENRVDGLIATLERRSLGYQASLFERLTELTMPVLLLAGESDAKYRLLNEEAASFLPNATAVVIPGGHAVHLEEPGACFDAVECFLKS